jgi:hypothetical protein
MKMKIFHVISSDKPDHPMQIFLNLQKICFVETYESLGYFLNLISSNGGHVEINFRLKINRDDELKKLLAKLEKINKPVIINRIQK